MGSLVMKLDKPTADKLKNMHHYSDLDVMTFKPEGDNEVPMAYDIEAVKISLRNILMWRVGESVLRPQFGHKIHRSMYEQMNEFNQEKICAEIKRAIEENEPRVQVKSVGVKVDDDDDSDGSSNALHVRVAYTVIGDRTEGAEFIEQATISER